MGKRNHQEVPAADDLAGWKEADSRLHRRIGSIFQKELLPSQKAAEQYFGDSDVESFFDAHYQRSVIPAYATWSFLHFRADRVAKTEAEKLLTRDLPEAQAILLQAKLASFPSLYRVARHEPMAGTIELEDVLLGGTQTIHDKAMSECVEDGLFLPLRLIPVGRFHFIDVAGAPLGRAMGTEAVEFLRSQGLQFTKDGLREGAHWFGRLWAWSDEWEDRLRNIQLKNMDGDDLLWQIASFSMADSRQVRQILESRDDIECDEDAFSWVQRTGQAAGTMGGAVNLAQIELVGDELIVTANSASRLAKARVWLEQIPGLKLINVVTRPWNEPEDERPPDEQMKDEPVEMTPEVVAAVQQQMDTHYMNWLDSPLPILNGKTPRMVCQTVEGKTRVAALIRTIQEPMGQSPITVPKQRMLADLGIEGEPVADESDFESPMDPSPPRSFGEVPSDKIGRNDPCPCGSGRKYKKCCGA